MKQGHVKMIVEAVEKFAPNLDDNMLEALDELRAEAKAA